MALLIVHSHSFLLHLLFFSQLTSFCKSLSISEVYLQNSDTTGGSTFIEILFQPATTVTELRRNAAQYAVFIVEANPTTITHFVDLSNSFTEDNIILDNFSHFVLCVDESVPNCICKFRFYDPVENFVIILAKKPQDTHLNTLGLEKVQNVIRLKTIAELTAPAINLLQSLAIDAIFLSQMEVGNDDIWITTVIPRYKGLPIVVPYGEEYTGDFSINRCSKTWLRSEVFSYGPPTPGKINYCQKQNQLKSIFSNHYEEPVSDAELVTTDPNDGDGKTKGDQFTEIPKSYQSHPLMQYLQKPEVKSTLSFFKDKNDASCSYFRCELCYRVYKNKETRKRLEYRKITDIMKPTGMSLRTIPTAAKLKAKIVQHYGKIHLEAVKISDTSTWTQIAEIPTDTEDRQEVTRKLIGLVYLETKLGLSFLAHDGLAKGLSFLGFNIGTRLQSSRAASSIVKHLADTLHTDLINYLATTRPPFSMMLDSRYNN